MKRADLLKTLELTGNALADNDLVPVFTCFMFRPDSIAAYNDDLSVIAPYQGLGGFAVNGKTLLGLLSNSHSEMVQFALQGSEVTIAAGQSTFKLPYFKPEEFLFEEPDEDWLMELPLDGHLLTGLKACLMTSGRDNSQPAFMGVALNQGSKRMTLYSCDGDAITRYITKVKKVDAEVPDYTLLNSFCEAVLKVSEQSQAGSGTVCVSEQWARAEFDNGYRIYGRLMERGTEPLDHAAEISKTVKGKPVYVPVPEGLDAALSRARVIADPESAQTVLMIKGGQLKLETTTHMGVVRDSLAASGHGDVVAHVSAALIQRSIGVCGEMTVLENCCAFRAGDELFVLTSNMAG